MATFAAIGRKIASHQSLKKLLDSLIFNYRIGSYLQYLMHTNEEFRTSIMCQKTW
jgi:hypothetical protein